jgi:uncharacterized protein (UPF0264 family)
MLNLPPESSPRLLVSVRDAGEARAAITGGADIIDIKEPRRGSLGKADDEAIRDIVETVRLMNQTMPISAALGELRDWDSTSTGPSLPGDVGYLKLGLSHCSRDEHWQTRWRSVVSGKALAAGSFCGDSEGKPVASASPLTTVSNDASPPSPVWVMVIYADWQRAGSPAPAELIQAAAEFSCGVVLLDTFHKDGRSLVEVLSPSELLAIAEAVHQANLPLAVAGSLRKEHLPPLTRLAPAIVAIRSAACRQGQRAGTICPIAVRDFRERTLCGLTPAATCGRHFMAKSRNFKERK